MRRWQVMNRGASEGAHLPPENEWRCATRLVSSSAGALQLDRPAPHYGLGVEILHQNSRHFHIEQKSIINQCKLKYTWNSHFVLNLK